MMKTTGEWSVVTVEGAKTKRGSFWVTVEGKGGEKMEGKIRQGQEEGVGGGYRKRAIIDPRCP